MAGKAKELDSLLRLRKWTVDERRRELGVLLAREQALLDQIAAMDDRMAQEQQVAAADPAYAGYIFSAFAESHRRQREQVEITVYHLRQEISVARDHLATAYGEQKVLEEVRKGRAIRERREEARRDQAAYDEIAQTQFRLRS
jgi:flagellar export protein FliJ